ncbi:hypothetical protein UFOVP672_20 [uncultured Caudovirales phage]|uniref:Large polyvalent protein associated domain-containing protein n=1 Tax=uncultured Caudovirales phage TaxID=2100421 RepID=A0A6J5NCA8_9CAUD|nr:hypothetical protein UFOVP672_20 [uncultured Caudovirales phage]
MVTSNLNDVATPSGVLTDEQFYGIQNAGGLSAVPVEDRGFFGAHLNQFMAFRESAPNEQWKQYKASEDAKRAEGMARLGSLSLDFDKATADVDLPSLKLAPDPATKQAGKDALLADTFIQHKTGQGFTGAMRERMRDAVATEFFGEGVGVGSDAEFAKAANAWAVKNRDFQKLVAGDGTGDSDSMSLQRWAAKTALVGVPAADAFAEWQKAVKDAPEYAAAKGKDLLGMWNDVYGKTAELVGDNAPRLRAAFEKMQASMGSKPGSAAGGDGTDVFDVSAELEGMSLEDFRKVGVPAIRAMAEFASKGDKGVMAQMLESFTRPIGNNVSAMGDVMQWLSAAMPSEMVLPESQLAGEQAGRDMRSQLRQLMDNTVDPITNLAKSGVGVNLENMLYDTAGSLGMMSQLAVPYVGAALQMAGYQDATVGRLLMEHPTMKPEDARLIGAIEAPFEYLGDKLEFAALKGRLPGASKLLSAMAGPGGSVGKFLGYVGLNAGIEYAAEKYQDAVPIVTQNLIAALKEDVPAGSWDDFKMLDLRTFLAVLPLSLIGAGVHTVVERGAVKELVQDKELLRVVGFSDEQISRITTGDDVGKRVEMVQALWSERGAVVTVARNESEAAADAVLQDPTAEVSQKVAAADYKATLGAVDALGNANADWKAAQAAMDDAGLSMQVERGADGKPLWTVRDRETGNETEHPTFNSAWAHVHGKMGEMDVEDALNMATVAEFFIKQKSGMGESVEFTGQVKSALDALAGDNATAEAMAERIRIEEQRQGLQPGELIAPLVLGSNRVAFAEMVGDATKRVVAASMSKVNAGGNVLTVIEEVIEGREKAVLDRDMKLRWVRMAEAATGEQFLKKGAADADVTARDLTEAVSHIVQAEVLNRRKNGGKFARVGGAVSAGLAKVGGDAKSSGQFKTFLGAMKALLGAIFRTAAKLSKAQREGKLGEDYHAFVDQLLGLDEQARHNAAVAGQVEGGLPQKGAEGAKDGGETFSLGRVEHLTAKTIDGRILHDKSARNSPSSILSALGLGKEGSAADSDQRRKYGRQLARASELARWAEGEGRSYHEKTALGAAERILGGGGEHVVFLDETGNRVLKRTKAGLFGAQGNDVGEYLQRWALHNEVFGDDVRIEGVTKLEGDDEIRVIVSQPFFEGRDATAEELSEYLASKGFVRWENWGAWVHPVRGVAVWDTQTPGNALMTAEGVRAIDLQIAPAANDVLKQVRGETGFGNETSFSLASGDYLESIAQRLDRAKADPVEKLAAFTRAAEKLAGMARAVRFNDANAIKRLSTTGIERERAKRQAEMLDEAYREIDSRYPHMGDLMWAASVANHPLMDLLSTVDSKSGKVKSRIMSKAAAKRQGKNVGGEYDGSEELPGFMFGGTNAPDALAEEAYSEGLISAPDTNILWEEINKALAQSAKAQGQLDKYNLARREARDDVRAEAAKWAKDQMAKQNGIDWEKRELGRAMAALDAMLVTFPPEVRQMVGGFTKLADLKGNKARLGFFAERVLMLEKAMDRHLEREYTKEMKALMERSRPKGDKGEKIKGKIGVQAHEWFAQIEPMMKMSSDAVAERLAGIEMALADVEDAAKQTELTTEWSLLQTYGAWGDKSALEMASAFGDAMTIFDTGRAGWVAVMAARRAEREGLRGMATNEAGGRATRAAEDAGNAKRRGAKGATVTNVKGWVRNLFSFRQVLASVFGHGSGVENRFDMRTRQATRLERAARMRREMEFNKALGDIYGAGKRIQRQRLLWDLVQPEKKTGVYFRETSRKEQAIPLDVAERILSGEVSAKESGLKAYEITELRWLMQEHLEKVAKGAAGARAENLYLPKLTRGKEHEKTLSRAQAMHLWMTYQMEEYRPALARDGVDEQTMREIEGFLKTPDLELINWLGDQYEAGYDHLNAPFQRLYGVALPKVKHYAPGTFQTNGNQAVALPGDSATGTGAMQSGFLRKRKNHTSKIDLSNEGGSLAHYWRHVTETEHWVAWAETVDEMKSVFFDKEVNGAVKAGSGISAADTLRTWVDTLENDGVKSGWVNLEMRKWLGAMMTGRAKVGLAWKVSVWLKQSTAALGSMLDLPAKDFARSAARVLAGKGAMSYADAKNLPVMQQRLAMGGSPEMRMAMQGATTYFKPGAVTEFMDTGMDAINTIDARFTMFSAAVAFDAHYSSALKAGMSEEAARVAAAELTDRTLARTAQPVETMDKSLHELSLPTIAKPLFMFISEVRQKAALEIAAVAGAFKGEVSWFEAGKIVAWNHLVLGSLTWALGSMWRDLMNDDDDSGDDPAWNVEDWLLAIVTGPLSGIPVLGDVITATASWATGAKSFPGESNLLAGNVADLAKGAHSVFSGDPPEGEELEFILKKVGMSAKALGQIVGGEVAAVGVGANIFEQLFNLGDDLIETDAEATGKERKKLRKLDKEAREAEDKARREAMTPEQRAAEDEAKAAEKQAAADAELAKLRAKRG